MTRVHRREAWIVLLIVAASLILFAYISSSHAQVIMEKPGAEAVLTPADFTVLGPSGSLTVGQTSRAEAMQVFPQGDNLGRSGVYRPQGLDCLLTFTRNEEILVRMDLGPGSLATSRGIKALDSFDQVVAQYGINYTKAYEKQTPATFDAYYGTDRYILFKVQDNVVQKIYIGSPLV